MFCFGALLENTFCFVAVMKRSAERTLHAGDIVIVHLKKKVKENEAGKVYEVFGYIETSKVLESNATGHYLSYKPILSESAVG